MQRGARQTRARIRRVSGLATKRVRALPSFLIIGAQRAGTTSLFYYLCSHPDVARPATKEIHFFDDNYWRGIDWYRSFFGLSFGRARVTGEATPYYLFHPAVPTRVAATIPDVRLIALLRNPVDRAYSHYHKMRRMGIERLSFKKALAAEERRLAGEEERLLADARYRSTHHRRHAYVGRGLYADQLEHWLASFPREQLLVLLSDDFFARPGEVYAQTVEFLGLPPWQPEALEDRNPASYKALAPEIRAGLEARFAEPNARLAGLLGRDVWAPSAPTQSSASSSA
jgi:lipopolysaccharide transport system ATP-binding protein